MSVQDEVKEIKKSFRLSMNGVVSTLQRRQGLDYKINFGVELPRLKEIADTHAKNGELAEALWRENIRECKILAILLMPDECCGDIAEQWIAETIFTEIADILAMHLLCKVPDATAKALLWSARTDRMFCYCGYRTLSHLIRRGTQLDKGQETTLFNNLATATFGDSVTEKCAHNTIMHYIDRNPDASDRFQDTIAARNSNNGNLTTLLKNIGL